MIHYIYASGRLIGHTRKYVGIASPMHARAILSQSECKALGIERSTMISCVEAQPDLPATGLTFDGEVSFQNHEA